MPNELPLPMMLVQRPVIEASSVPATNGATNEPVSVAGMKAVSVVAKVPAAAAA